MQGRVRLVLPFLACIACVWGQTTTAVLSGVVSDPAGASVPAAKVTLSSSDTGFFRPFVTQETGQFVFPLLPPGQYQLRIERTGFKLYVHSGIQLGAGQASRINPVLEISADPQVVVVEDAARVLDAASGMNVSLRGESLHDMPMEGRNFLNLAGTAPGVVGRGSLSDFDNFAPEMDFDFSANGRGTSGNIFLLDGLNVTSNIVSGVANLSPNPDSIQEYNVQTNTFTVDQGRASSLQVSMVTRGGTNVWHGTGSYFFSNQDMMARTVFTSAYAPFKKHTGAATLGGPILSNRLFFFSSTELLRSNESLANSVSTYESPEFVSWAKATYPNSVGVRALSEAPVIGVSGLGVAKTARDVIGPQCGTAASAILPCDMPMVLFGENRPTDLRNGLQYNLRLDRYFRDSRDRIFGNYYRTTLDLGRPVFRAGTENASSYGSHALELSWVHTFTSDLLNEASFSGVQVYGDQAPKARYHIPEIDISGQSTNISPGWGGSYAQHHYYWRDVLTWVRGRHILKAGGNFYWSDDSADFTATSARPTFSFTNLLDLVQDKPQSEYGLGYNPVTGQPAAMVFGGQVPTAGVFVQDEWTAAPNLSFTFGIRWDDFGNPTGKHGMRFSNLSYAPGATLDQRIANAVLRTGAHPYVHPLNHNFSPRAGFAWSPRGEGTWRVHGGIGGYQDWIPLGQPVDLMRQNPPNYIFPTFRSDGAIKPLFNLGTSDTYPFGFVLPQIPYGQFDPRGGLVGARPDIGFVRQDLTSPYTLNYLAGIERRLSGGLLAGLSYSGSYTRNALLGTDLNRVAGDLLDGQLDRLNPSFGAMNGVWNGNAIHYNGLIATLHRELTAGFGVQASYTLSKTTDYVQAGTRQNRDGAYAIPDQHAIQNLQSYADWDVRHRFTLTGLWHVPEAAASLRGARRLLSGWELTTVAILQSGTPFTVINRNAFDPLLDASGKVIGLKPDSGDYNADGYNYDFPNAPSRNFSGSHTRRQFLNGVFGVADFPVPVPGTQGNLKRNIYRNPGLLSVDAGLIKNNVVRALGKPTNVQLRFEFFNALNRVNLQSVDNNLGSSTFGRSTAAYTPRVIQLGLRMAF